MKSFDSATCPLCKTYFDRLPVEGDEDGAYVALEVRPCLECGALLCPCCDQFQSDCCDGTFYQSHLTLVSDGTPKPLKCCTACAREIEQQELELPEMIGVQSETRPFLVAGKVVA